MATRNTKAAHPSRSAAASVKSEKPLAEKSEVSYVVRELDPHSFVTVKNGFTGTLVYQSKRTGEVFQWDSFGAEQDMELQELKTAKSNNKAFFTNNWFLFDDPEIIEYLGVSKFYKNALNSDNFDEVFEKPPEEIRSIISKLSNGQKRSLAYRAKQLIREHEIDSIRVIDSLEQALGTNLIER